MHTKQTQRKNMRLLLSLLLLFITLGAESVTVEYYVPDEPVEPVNTSRYNMNYSLWPPSKKAFESFLHNSVIHQGAVQLSIGNPMISPNSALISAMYHDYVENNASLEVFSLYEYAANNNGIAGRRRGYLAFGDFLLRTKNYGYIRDNLDPNSCYQNKPVCSYYKVISEFLNTGFCSLKQYESAIKYSRKSLTVKSVCRNNIKD
jgi:hypothetical protein